MKVILILANSADPDEMQHYAAFLLGRHCLPKYHRDFPTFSKSGPGACYILEKKTFGPSKLGKLDAVKKNQTANLNGLKPLRISS